MSAAKRGGDAAHREQLVELRGWCESEVRTERERERVGQKERERAKKERARQAEIGAERQLRQRVLHFHVSVIRVTGGAGMAWHGMAWSGMTFNV